MESTLYDKSNVQKFHEQTKMTRKWKEMCLITYFLWNFTDFSHFTGEIPNLLDHFAQLMGSLIRQCEHTLPSLFLLICNLMYSSNRLRWPSLILFISKNIFVYYRESLRHLHCFYRSTYILISSKSCAI